ncbi:hypothetical protein PGTUg99_031004 [Puccinia graminis f. sp. tritici]|uniref:Uncharacterized protein n=1 Tax=Puccinia graminis f. sp. tritici TaxID=56615 RepID=A0A5B0S8R5_PUCGR|nr:hypothetical protein PGTUg99_031004 [Puccinia graminis f. sp. tritici]
MSICPRSPTTANSLRYLARLLTMTSDPQSALLDSKTSAHMPSENSVFVNYQLKKAQGLGKRTPLDFLTTPKYHSVRLE